MAKTIFSGIQPSGNLHLGNLLGMIYPSVKLQQPGNDLIFMIADLHALTLPHNVKNLKEHSLDIVSWFLAVGFDPKKSQIFIQSENSDHPYLMWILNCFTTMSQLERMTQFKDKTQKHGGVPNVGLFNYPVLQASDVLLYDVDLVPVGEDQKQHIELIRDVAEKFNKTYKEIVFKIPRPLIKKETARIMSLQSPSSKMSKSDRDQSGTINLLDSADEVRAKLMKAVTDSGSEIVYREDKPAISNLLVIFSEVTGKNIKKLEEEYAGKGYGEFKRDLAEAVLSFLKPIQEKYRKLRGDEAYLNQVLNEGAVYSSERSSKKVEMVKKVMGLGRLNNQ